jgi:hypothetical protein
MSIKYNKHRQNFKITFLLEKSGGKSGHWISDTQQSSERKLKDA